MEIGLAAFDMDGTLTQGRLVFALADRFGLSEEVRKIQASGLEGHRQTKAIAALFRGLSRSDLEQAVESIPLTDNAERLVSILKESGCKLGIISDSYTVAASMVATRLGMDFVAANSLEIAGDRITGEVSMPLGWEKVGCYCKISVCKRYHLEENARRFGVPIEKTMAIGDTKSDMCMIQRAGVGIAFMPKDKQVEMSTGKIVRAPDMLRVLEFLR